MTSNRIIYGLTVLALTVLLYFFGLPMLLYSIVFLLALAVFLFFVLRAEMGKVSLSCSVRSGSQVGKPLTLTVEARGAEKLIAGKTIQITMDVTNSMTGDSIRQVLHLPLQHKSSACSVVLTPENCGEVTFVCQSVLLWDHLDLFSRKLSAFPPVRTIVYPQGTRLEVHLSQQENGSPREDGPMQNRRGNDPSEVFDIRDYQPGDDVRSIHWKLSVKTDSLILREPGTPAYYDLVVLPDFGLTQDGLPTNPAERNAAIAYGSAALRQLVRQGIRCCLALPTAAGICLKPIASWADYQDAMAQWLSLRLAQTAGDGLQMFLSEHLDQSFSRILLLNAGKLTKGQSVMRTQSALTVVSATLGGTESTTTLGALRLIELPAEPLGGAVRRISC